MSLTRSQIIILGIGLLLVTVFVLMFVGVLPGFRSNETKDISGKLTFWGVHDTKQTMEDTLLAEYKKVHPGVEIVYREMNPATYESDLLNALAAGKGPDIFMVKNTWLPSHRTQLSGLSEEQYPVASLRSTFPSVVEQDFYSSSTVYAFPLAIDTLALFYNKSLFDNAGIATPPKTWEELESLVPRLRTISIDHAIKRSAIALGGSAKTVDHASDIMSLLLLQSNLPIVNDNLDATFAVDGESALWYYTSFANPGSNHYTWTDSFPRSSDAFAQESVAMMLGYSSEIEAIKEKNPFLNFAVSPMLQRKEATLDTNYASYWGLGVAAASRNASLAWNFIGTVALNPEMVRSYLTQTGRHPALRTLIGEAAENPQDGFFARQALTAKSWYQPDATLVDTIFSDMIENVITGRLSTEKSIRNAQEEINAILKQQALNENP